MRAFWLTAALGLATTGCLAHDQSRPLTADRSAAATARPPVKRGAPEPLRRTATPPASCAGTEELRLEGVYIETDAVGVSVVGDCDVVIVDSEINAGTSALLLEGSGSVEIRDSLIQGGQNAIDVRGNGSVRATNSRFVGDRAVAGSGSFVDGGNNTWE